MAGRKRPPMTFITIRWRDVERFFTKVSMGNGCWKWIGEAPGTPQFQVLKRKIQARRYLFSAMGNPVPLGHCVYSTCGNKLCVRPSHLYVEAESVAMRRMWLARTPCGHGLTVGKCNRCHAEYQRRWLTERKKRAATERINAAVRAACMEAVIR